MTKAGQGTSTEREGGKTISPTIRDIDKAVYEKFGFMCANLGIYHREGFKRAVELWEKYSDADVILEHPPFDGLAPTVREEFRRRCMENRLTLEGGIQDAIIVWLRNFAFIDPPAPKKKGRRNKPGKKRERLPL